MGKTKCAIVIPDVHAPLHDKKAVSVACKAIEMVKPDTVINLGDMGEWDSVSAWKYKKKKRPPVEYIIKDVEKDKKSVGKVLDQFDAACHNAKVKKKYMLLGNHEMWLDNFIEEHPYLEKEYLKWHRQYEFPHCLYFNQVLMLAIKKRLKSFECVHFDSSSRIT